MEPFPLHYTRFHSTTPVVRARMIPWIEQHMVDVEQHVEERLVSRLDGVRD
jgi:hypothetical protein